jgi:hypothetical protein
MSRGRRLKEAHIKVETESRNLTLAFQRFIFINQYCLVFGHENEPVPRWSLEFPLPATIFGDGPLPPGHESI